MKLYRIAFVLTLVFLVLITVAVLFICLVPMNFYIDFNGRVEPRTTRRLECALEGTIARVVNEKSFRKGDVLFALKDDVDQRKRALLDDREELLRAELETLRSLAETERKQWRWELDQTRLDLEKAGMELNMQSKQLKNYKVMAENLRKQKQLDRDLKNKEADILSALYEKHVLTKMDYLRIMYEKSMAVAAAQEIEFRTQQGLFDNALREKQIEADEDALEARLNFLKSLPNTALSFLSVENQLLELRRERIELDERIKLKTQRAPFDGVVLATHVNPGDRVYPGEAAIDIACDDELRFVAWAGQNNRNQLRAGMQAEIYLDNYFFHRHGLMNGTVEDIQTYLGDGKTSSGKVDYRLTITIEEPFRKFETGLTGRAKIIIFHGSTLEYVMSTRGFDDEDKPESKP